MGERIEAAPVRVYLVRDLRALAAAEHMDLSIAADAADEIERLRDLIITARQIVCDVAPGYTVWLDEAEEALGFRAVTDGR